MALTAGQVAQTLNTEEKGATLSQFCHVPI